jgi:hypothetical protein
MGELITKYGENFDPKEWWEIAFNAPINHTKCFSLANFHILTKMFFKKTTKFKFKLKEFFGEVFLMIFYNKKRHQI